MTTILDTSAWIELFVDGKNGEGVKSRLAAEDCYTSSVSVAEITEWAIRGLKDPNTLVGIIDSTTQIIDVGKEIASLAGRINFNRKKEVKNWGMADSLIAATAGLYNLRILTCDHHFVGLPMVDLLKA